MSLTFLLVACSALSFNIGVNLYFRRWLNERRRKCILISDRDIEFWSFMWMVVKLFMIISVITGALAVGFAISEM